MEERERERRKKRKQGRGSDKLEWVNGGSTSERMRKEKNSKRITTFMRTAIKVCDLQIWCATSTIQSVTRFRLFQFSLRVFVDLIKIITDKSISTESTCRNASQVSPTTFFISLCET